METLTVSAINQPWWLVISLIATLKYGFVFLYAKPLISDRFARAFFGTTGSVTLMILFVESWPNLPGPLLVAIIAVSILVTRSTRTYMDRDRNNAYPNILNSWVSGGVPFYLATDFLGYLLLIPAVWLGS